MTEMTQIRKHDVQDMLQAARRMASSLAQIDDSKILAIYENIDKAKKGLAVCNSKLEDARMRASLEWDSHVIKMQESMSSHNIQMKDLAKELSAARKKSTDEQVRLAGELDNFKKLLCKEKDRLIGEHEALKTRLLEESSALDADLHALKERIRNA